MAKRKERVIQLVNKGCGQKWLFGVEYMESQSWGSPLGCLVSAVGCGTAHHNIWLEPPPRNRVSSVIVRIMLKLWKETRFLNPWDNLNETLY